MTDIRQARDVLAKYRSYAGTAQEWGVRGGTSRLVRIATDPELLDALNKTLEQADKMPPTTEWGDHGLRMAGQRIAAAIIAADERMNA